MRNWARLVLLAGIGFQIWSFQQPSLVWDADGECDRVESAQGLGAPLTNVAANHLLTSRGFNVDPSDFGEAVPGPLSVTPLAQNRPDSDGQTAVAMAINTLTGQNLSDDDIDQRYGYQLLQALNHECQSAHYHWSDAGDMAPSAWPLLEHKICIEKVPVVVALNGPDFSASGRGHIVLLCALEGEVVGFCDPATGTLRSTTRAALQSAPSHPDGNFLFVPSR